MDNLISFEDIFTTELLNNLYVLFEKHINQTKIETKFKDIITLDVLNLETWGSIQKTLKRHNIPLTKKDASEFLESNCYRVWFAKKQLEGHSFNFYEKSALAGFAFFFDNAEEGDNVDDFINEQRELSKDFVDSVFRMNIQGFVQDYESYLANEKKIREQLN